MKNYLLRFIHNSVFILLNAWMITIGFNLCGVAGLIIFLMLQLHLVIDYSVNVN